MALAAVILLIVYMLFMHLVEEFVSPPLVRFVLMTAGAKGLAVIGCVRSVPEGRKVHPSTVAMAVVAGECLAGWRHLVEQSHEPFRLGEVVSLVGPSDGLSAGLNRSIYHPGLEEHPDLEGQQSPS